MVTPFWQSKPPIYLGRARRESLHAQARHRAADGLASGHRDNLLERYDYPNMGLGWALPVPEVVPYVPSGRVCFWGGWGGSMVINDADRRVTLAYMMNRMAPGIIGGPVIAQLAALAFSLPAIASRSSR